MVNKNISSKSLKNTLIKKSPLLMVFMIIILSFNQCANIQRPTGGPKDTIPPKLIAEYPPNLTTNFSAKKIVIEFDEFIKLQNQQREISYSPDMEEKPSFIVRRKELHMELPDSLEKETTYLINFGNAIVDNNESNPIMGYQYVFSTGDKIDSLSIKGTVFNAIKNSPEIGASVILIPEDQDTTIFGKKRANIFAQTDSSGNFTLSYLKEGNYKLYALKESSPDRIYNNANEYLAFLDSSINLTKDTSGIKMFTSLIKDEKLRILDRGIATNSIIWMKLNRDLDNPKVEIIEPKDLDADKVIRLNTNKDSINMWVNSLEFDSLKLRVYDDILNLQDSITIRKPRGATYENKITIQDNLLSSKVDKVTHIELTSSHPLESIDRSKIELQEDSVVRTNFQLIRDTADNHKYIIRYNWKEKTNYSLKIDSGAFIGKFNEINKEYNKTFTLDENVKYGDIKLNITIPDTTHGYIVQILNEKKDRVLRSDYIEYKNSTYLYNLQYNDYLEGKYNIRIIYDINNNGKWDPGNLKSLIQPEKAWYFDKTINIRPNWEQEENVVIPPL